MLNRFGSIAGILAASPAELKACAGRDDTWVEPFSAVIGLFYAGLDERVERSPLDPADPALHYWLRSQFMGAGEERLIGLFGDNQGRFITHEILAKGGRSELVTSARAIFRRAFTLDASELILAHNHPSGHASPSRADIRATLRLRELGCSLGVTIREHFIVTPGGITALIRPRG